MKEIIIPEQKFNVYSFNELSEESQQTAIDNFVNEQINSDFSVFHFHDDYEQSLKSFCELFNCTYEFSIGGGYSYVTIKTGQMNNDALNLKGHRLVKWIINNTKLLKSVFDKKPCLWKDSYKIHRENLVRKPYTENIKYLYEDCMFTGYYYDNELTYPFIEYVFKGYTLEVCLEHASEQFYKCWQNDYDHVFTEEYAKESLENSDIEFLENGEVYND